MSKAEHYFSQSAYENVYTERCFHKFPRNQKCKYLYARTILHQKKYNEVERIAEELIRDNGKFEKAFIEGALYLLLKDSLEKSGRLTLVLTNLERSCQNSIPESCEKLNKLKYAPNSASQK